MSPGAGGHLQGPPNMTKALWRAANPVLHLRLFVMHAFWRGSGFDRAAWSIPEVFDASFALLPADPS
jgi:hypothetical protein